MKIPRSKSAAPYLNIQRFGPIKKANVEFGDLTVLVGPQAAGKSVFLQVLKLLVDTAHIKKEFDRSGVDWQGDFKQFLDVYFGEGMRSVWTEKSHLDFGGMKGFQLSEFVEAAKSKAGESMFFIPAQRVLALRDGWPSAFNYYDASVPFALREFSEQLRLLVSDMGSEGTLFPVPRRLKNEFKDLLQQHVFGGYSLEVDNQRAQKRLVLKATNGDGALPVAVWSAGQREFVPLLLGLYWLMVPAGAPKRRGVDWVVIEELEMGLHPRAITVVLLMVVELMARGYRVCLSTHSTQVLEAVWALRTLRAKGASPESLLAMFDAPNSPPMVEMAKRALKKNVKVYYFERDKAAHDISDLDPNSEDAVENAWGGLTEFSGRANDAVARAVANSKDFLNT
jgi:hypothetical protein